MILPTYIYSGGYFRELAQIIVKADKSKDCRVGQYPGNRVNLKAVCW